MTVYNPPTDVELAPEKPGKSSLFIRMRDLVIAVTEGSAGAPKIQTAALNDLSVTTAKIATNEQMNSTNVGTATAGLAGGAVGTYIIAHARVNVADYPLGATVSGASLYSVLVSGDVDKIYPASGAVTGDSVQSSGVTGTWRSMSNAQNGRTGATYYYPANLWLRIA